MQTEYPWQRAPPELRLDMLVRRREELLASNLSENPSLQVSWCPELSF
jgi:hypothetical protein